MFLTSFHKNTSNKDISFLLVSTQTCGCFSTLAIFILCSPIKIKKTYQSSWPVMHPHKTLSVKSHHFYGEEYWPASFPVKSETLTHCLQRVFFKNAAIMQGIAKCLQGPYCAEISSLTGLKLAPSDVTGGTHSSWAPPSAETGSRIYESHYRTV